MTTWFITGASRGFGLEIARQALERGDSVVATARDPLKVESALGAHAELLAVELDVRDAEQARAAVDVTVRRFGRIDVLVNNAGHGQVGAVEETSDEEVRKLFDINVFGLLTVTRAVLPVMRPQRSGRILNLSSIGGFVSWPGWGAYCATKHAVEGYSMAMRQELGPLGIQVTSVAPGPFRTDFLDLSSLQTAQGRIDDYDASAGAMRAWAAETNHTQEGDPVRAAAAILVVADAERAPLHLPLGSSAVAGIEAKLTEIADDVRQWREIAESTDFPDAVDGRLP
ncbi:oxidoreductase [Allokutzneria sp. A3M-2-11 16]|uniref:oxidoreductase n=1 Tax=Allokutzneria sp. A3M-2-11 16 TaxID=2962043 RepID=UPI0020B6EF68|nr:oxidoreductase [Allokutzneria sp. A3M-2-11 16]MCP3801394.1 oxidoreductase [Allokutzneria sp. A3M-2-11 16]